ncbi:MAG TPA: anaerobic sulfatase maturase [Anaerolineae bacterium]|nr:anaerobic sulfatase maturase [Anaerolineae bacterium]
MTVSLNNYPPAFHLLAKPSGATCNLDCAYCFFLSKEMLYPGSRFRMADAMLESYIRQLIEAHQTPQVNVAWQGGEPTLMGLDFFRRSIEYAERYRKPGMQIEYTIQTNGTLIDDDWAAFFRQHNFLVGISIDGPRAMHDAYRVDKGGQPTFDKVMRGLGLLQKHGVEYNTLTTLHHANADHPVEVYRFLRDDCGSGYQQYIPIIERLDHSDDASDHASANAPLSPSLPPPVTPAPWTSWRDRPLYTQAGDLVTDRSVTAEQYGRFLIGVFEEWVRRDVGAVYVQMFDVALANWVGEPSGLCVHSKTCGLALALEHNGDLYACDHYVEPAYRLGNIAETPMIELIASPQQQKFGQDKFDTLPRYCLECDVRFACHGGCPKDRFCEAPRSPGGGVGSGSPDGEPGLNYLCAGYKLFFHHIDQPMRFMADMLRRGRAPAEIMQVYAARDAALQQALAAAGRNDPCPCGSGKKFKQCHGRQAHAPTA